MDLVTFCRWTVLTKNQKILGKGNDVRKNKNMTNGFKMVCLQQM